MARIRTIKPDALQHRKVGKLSDRAFRVWIGLLTQADDEGRLPCETEQIAAWCFGYHRGVTLKQIEDAIAEIESLHLISLYAVNGTRYCFFPSWKDHQRIDRPTKSLIPGPSEDNLRSFDEHSTNIRVSLLRDRKGREGKGEEGNGKEGIRKGGMEGNQEIPFDEILNDLNGRLGKRYTLTAKHRELISARCKEGHGLEDFIQVHANMIEAWGNDQKMREFLRPITLYSPKFESYLNRMGRQPIDDLSEEGKQTLTNIKEWINDGGKG